MPFSPRTFTKDSPYQRFRHDRADIHTEELLMDDDIWDFLGYVEYDNE